MSRSPGPGLTSRQTRDGRSWRTGPLFSFCPRAPRLSCHALPACRGVCGRAGVVVSGPDLRSPASCLTAWAGPWSSDAADALASPPWRVPRGRSSPRRWGPSRRCAARPLLARERDLLGPLWCPWSAPGRPSGARGRAVVSFPFPSVLLGVSAAVVCPVSGSLGGVETVKGAGACLCFSPSVGDGGLPPRRHRPPTVCRGGD